MRLERQSVRPIIAFYVGAYGPTIRIDIQTKQDLAALRSIFEQLRRSPQDISLVAALAAHAEGLRELILSSVPPRAPKHVKVLAAHGSDRPTFQWFESPDTWSTCIDLLDAFHDDEAGHQYLTPEGLGDALVEFAYCEQRPSSN
jgi:hypothetical protein